MERRSLIITPIDGEGLYLPQGCVYFGVLQFRIVSILWWPEPLTSNKIFPFISFFFFFFFWHFFFFLSIGASAIVFFFCRRTIGHSLEGYQIYFLFFNPPVSFPYSFLVRFFSFHRPTTIVCRFCTTLCVCFVSASLHEIVFPFFYVRVV